MSKKVKQISYLSAIVISVGSTIGAGIFFKNGTIFNNAGGSLGFMIASWLVAAIGVLAIGLSLIEITSKTKGKAGIFEWVKKFTPKRFAKYSASYMLFVYMPLTYFAMPIYAVMSLQDAIGSSFTFTGWETIGIAFLFFMWIALMGYFRTRTAEKVQWAFTILKYIPLIVVPIISMVGIGQDGVTTQIAGASATGLTGFSPWLGIIASIPAILFAVDGFYTVASMELKDEKKGGAIMAISISIIMATYLFFAIFLGLDGQGDFTTLSVVVNNPWIGITINVIIIMAVLGIINGFAMSIPSMYHTFHTEGDTGMVVKIQRWFRIRKVEDAAFWTSIILAIGAFILLTPLALYVWKPTGYASYGASSAALYEMTDLVTNFTSLMLFIFIVSAIAGGIVNRKTNRVEVKKNKYFLPAAWTAVVFTIVGAGYMIIANIVDIAGINGSQPVTESVKFGIFIVTALGALIPTYWDKISAKLKPKFDRARNKISSKFKPLFNRMKMKLKKLKNKNA